ncbi:SAM-dependent methyltransferase [Chryseosolibacter indicus]|uniref:SAM-dependent methyltransferase n=1 Tax=Chryseosolibacter indicus TaxID=2782351 RepID=A0ABS5VY85_9BACT|nr:SAM-dependent methyltransferase [Chryseosolibacter indicus]MBT1706375.1 SAM-dependent methyltransferase [Chryseosolibacter indicus]
MANKGKLFLIPNVIADGTVDYVITPQVREILPEIQHFVVENIRTARRFLSSLKLYPAIESLQFLVLDKDTKPEDVAALMEPLFHGHDVGVISESGCPGVADPGALAVSFAHKNDVKVIPLVGPSSILLALMASGLNGQKFAFHGYIPIDNKDASVAIKAFEKESKSKHQTQIFIETPYRNNAIFKLLVNNLHESTLLTIAVNLTATDEMILTKTVKSWKSIKIELPKAPAVFLFLTNP